MATALITGSSTGIGFATALELARAGHPVVATMRSPERSPDLRRVAERESLPITVLAMNVSRSASTCGNISERRREAS